jgi:hypothetical protein
MILLICQAKKLSLTLLLVICGKQIILAQKSNYGSAIIEQIIQRNDPKGYRHTLKAVSTECFSYGMRIGDTTYTQLIANNQGLYYFESRSKKIQKKQGFDGQTHWTIRNRTNTFFDSADNYLQKQKNHKRVFLSITPILLIADAYENKEPFKIIEDDILEDEPCYSITFEYREKSITEQFYVSKKNLLIIMVKTTSKEFDDVISTYYKDYRLIEGLSIPFRLDNPFDFSHVTVTTIVKKINFSPSIDAKIFSKPSD